MICKMNCIECHSATREDVKNQSGTLQRAGLEKNCYMRREISLKTHFLNVETYLVVSR